MTTYTDACKTYFTMTIYNCPPEDESSGFNQVEGIKKLKIKILL
jgi:hypothetical protein